MIDWQFNPFVIPLLFGGILSILIAQAAWQRQNILGNRHFTLFMGALSVWIIGYAFELTVVTLETKLFWSRVQYIGIAVAAQLWLIFLLHYSGREHWLTRTNLIGLFTIPLLTITFVWLQSEWIWLDITVVSDNGLSHLDYEYGPWFSVHTAFSYLVYCVNTILVAQIALRSPQLDRTQGYLLLIGMFVPWVSNALYLGGILPRANLDLTPISLATAGIFIAWGIFQFRLLDLSPVADHAVVNGLPDGVLTVDADNMIMSFNPAAERLFGRTKQQVRDLPLRVLLPPTWAGIVYGSPCNLEQNFDVQHTRNGQTHYFDMYLAPIYDRRERLAGRIIVLRDVTEQRTAQLWLTGERQSLEERIEERTTELRHANEELVRAAQLKDEFLASMSHELRTPLNAILGTAEAIQDEIYGSINGAQRRSMERLEESASHLLALITDILDVSKIESGEYKLQLAPTSINDVCQSSLRLVNASALKKGLKIVCAIQTSMTQMYVDERRLKQILVNLLSNAVKFTLEGGKIGLGVFDDPTRKQIQFVVWDTGIGISKRDQERLFEPFIQLDSDLAKPHEGTGLGLALSQRLAQLHGGHIIVQSESGKGSRFTLSLPLEQASSHLSNGVESAEILPPPQRLQLQPIPV